MHGTEQCACMLLYVQSAALKTKLPSLHCALIDMWAAWPCTQDSSGNSQALGVDYDIEQDLT